MLLTVGLSLVLSFGVPPAPGPAPRAAQPREPRANVLLVVVDDCSPDLLGCYGSPTAAPTPNIDALAAGGCRFDAAFANPLCSPTRAQLLTGRHAWRTGVGSNVEPESQWGLPFHEVTLPATLRSYGYATGAFGKWHLAAVPTQGPSHPNLMGSDEFAGSIANLAKRVNGPNDGDYYDWELLRNGTTTDLVGQYATTKVTDLAVRWCAQATEPWFAYVPFNAPHAPYHYPPAALHTRDLAGNPEDDKPLFARAALEACDTEIGRLVATIRANAEGAVMVLLLGDNGTAKGAVLPPAIPEHGKGTLYDGGIRVPLVVNGPGIPAGRVTPKLVSATDVFATVLEIAEVPLQPGSAEDSISFLGLAEGSDPAAIRRYVYAERYAPNGPTGSKSEYSRMVRDGRWKLIRHKGAPDELYHLPDDPLEQDDLLLSTLDSEAQAAYVRLQRDLPEVDYH